MLEIGSIVYEIICIKMHIQKKISFLPVTLRSDSCLQKRDTSKICVIALETIQMSLLNYYGLIYWLPKFNDAGGGIFHLTNFDNINHSNIVDKQARQFCIVACN